MSRSRPPELRGSRWRALLLGLARVPRGRALAVRLACEVEGGQFFSQTARQILERDCGVRIGAYSYGPFFTPGAFAAGLVVGRYVSAALGLRYAQRNHPLDRISTHPLFYNADLGLVPHDNITSGNLWLGHDAWIGANVFITARCTRIGIGAVVGACSVVTRDIPDYAVVAGNPARILRYRFSPAVIAELLASHWWELDVAACARQLEHFVVPLEDVAQHPVLLAAGQRRRVESPCLAH